MYLKPAEKLLRARKTGETMWDCWHRRRMAKEFEFFNRKNLEALEKLRVKYRTKPIAPEGEKAPTLICTLYHDVEIIRDPSSGGVWMSEVELQKLLAKTERTADDKSDV